MGDTENSHKETGDSWENLHAVSAKMLVPGVSHELVTDLYNQWANQGYDKVLQEAASGDNYGALKMAQQTMQDLFPSGRDTATLLDVGAGTGLSGTDDTYDAVVLVGVVGHGGLPSAAFEEMTRIVKPGGYIVNCMRKAYMEEIPDYSQNWKPMQSRLQAEGRWRVRNMDTYPNHFIGKEGLRMVIQVHHPAPSAE